MTIIVVMVNRAATPLGPEAQRNQRHESASSLIFNATEGFTYLPARGNNGIAERTGCRLMASQKQDRQQADQLRAIDLGITGAVSEISGFEGLSGEITYSGTNGTPRKAVPIHQIVDGKDTLVATIGG